MSDGAPGGNNGISYFFLFLKYDVKAQKHKTKQYKSEIIMHPPHLFNSNSPETFTEFDSVG